MAKASVALISALSFLALASFIQCAPQKFTVEGKVYCDTCRVQFETRISKNLEGAQVRLECKNIDNNTVTYSVEGTTKDGGQYSLIVEGDHQKDICEVTVLKSPRADCKETSLGLEKARVVCTDNVGMDGPIRQANPLFFMKDKADPRCPQVLKEIDYFPDGGIM